MSSEASWVGNMPDVYERALGPALFRPFAEVIAAKVAALAPRRVLELAAGTGIATAALVAALPGAEITATDLNLGMVEWASERIDGPTWRQADAQHLDFPDGAFDVVMCQFGVMFFPDKPAAFAEIARVLAPGGSLVFLVWDSVELSRFPGALVESLAVVLPDNTPNFVVRVPHGYHDREQIRADLIAGGLDARETETVVRRGSSKSARALAEGYCLGTPLRFALKERGQLEELTAAVATDMTKRLGHGAIEADSVALLVTAQRLDE